MSRPSESKEYLAFKRIVSYPTLLFLSSIIKARIGFHRVHLFYFPVNSSALAGNVQITFCVFTVIFRLIWVLLLC